MTEPYVGPEANAMDIAAGLIAGTAIAATIGWTRATLVEGDSSATPMIVAHGLLWPSAVDLERDSSGSFSGTVTVDVDLLWPPYVGITDPAETLRRALGDWATLRRQIIAASEPYLQGISGDAPVRLDASADPSGWWAASMSFTFRCAE